MNAIKVKCQGNPQLVCELFLNMLQNGIVMLSSDGFVKYVEEHLDTCHTLNNWSDVPVPRLALKINQHILSQFIAEFTLK